MKKRTPPPLVHQISATVRNASVRDPGEATIGYYVVGGGTLTLTDERGLPLENQEPVSVANDSDCRAIASHLVWTRWDETADSIASSSTEKPAWCRA